MRSSYQTRPYEKLMEVYHDFSGGINTVAAPDSMNDNELTDLLNEDIGNRGSLKRRYGMRKLYNIMPGKSQGYFRYYRTDGTFDAFHAVDGKIYKGDDNAVEDITGLPGNSFQATRSVEGVQLNGILYVATGTKLIQYNGTAWSVVDAYLPTTMEMTYIGANAIAANPEEHLKDTIGLVPAIDYVYPTKPTGVVNEETPIKVFCTKVSGESYQYAVQVLKEDSTSMWEYPAESEFKALSGQLIDIPKVTAEGDYQISVVMRRVGDDSTVDLLAQYIFPYHYDLIYTPPVNPAGTNTIHTCNRAIVYGSRMFMYGDPTNPAVVYISQVNNPSYFPGLLTLEFENPRREGLNCLVPYRNGLLAFTKTSTQILTGTSPEDYTRKILHTEIGCISPHGAAVMQNQVGFLSTHGVFTMKTSSFTDDKASVQKIDLQIENIVPLDPNAIAIFEDNQLKITFPSTKTRLRYYQTLGSWTKDYSEHFDITGSWMIDGDIFLQKDGSFYVFDKEVFNDDDYNYTNLWESKYLSFGQPYHRKKLREIQILSAPNNIAQNCAAYVFADESAVIEPDSSYASVVDGVVVWNVKIDPNLHVPSGTEFGQWLMGDNVLGPNKFALSKLQLTGRCQRTRVRVENTAPNENQFIGFAYIFKLKRPN